ncbi:hypothetical protein HAX54_034488, partial [Datura stramonium]|nr:hypothetical protein [Datura stramonium]
MKTRASEKVITLYTCGVVSQVTVKRRLQQLKGRAQGRATCSNNRKKKAEGPAVSEASILDRCITCYWAFSILLCPSDASWSRQPNSQPPTQS